VLVLAARPVRPYHALATSQPAVNRTAFAASGGIRKKRRNLARSGKLVADSVDRSLADGETSGGNEYCARARRTERKKRGGEKERRALAVLESMRMSGGSERQRTGRNGKRETREGRKGKKRDSEEAPE